MKSTNLTDDEKGKTKALTKNKGKIEEVGGTSMCEDSEQQSILRSLLGKPSNRMGTSGNDVFHNNIFMTNNVSCGQNNKTDIEDYLSEDSTLGICSDSSNCSTCSSGDSINHPISKNSSINRTVFPSSGEKGDKKPYSGKDNSKNMNEKIKKKVCKPAQTAMQLIQRLAPTPMMRFEILSELDEHQKFLSSNRLLSEEDAYNYGIQHRKHILRLLGEMENSRYKKKLELIEERLMLRRRPDIRWEGYNMEGKYYVKKSTTELREDRERYELLPMQCWIKGKHELFKRFEKMNLKREQNMKFENERQEFCKRLDILHKMVEDTLDPTVVATENPNSMFYTSVIFTTSIDSEYAMNRNKKVEEEYGSEEMNIIAKCVELFPWAFSHSHTLEMDKQKKICADSNKDQHGRFQKSNECQEMEKKLDKTEE